MHLGTWEMEENELNTSANMRKYTNMLSFKKMKQFLAYY